MPFNPFIFNPPMITWANDKILAGSNPKFILFGMLNPADFVLLDAQTNLKFILSLIYTFVTKTPMTMARS